MALCEVALSDGLDLVAKEMEFGQGWNSPSHTLCITKFLLYLFVLFAIFGKAYTFCHNIKRV